MKPLHAILVSLALSCLPAFLAGCSDDDSFVAPANQLVLDPEAGPDFLLDPLGLDSVWVVGDTLHLAVTYAGGCKQHRFRAYAPIALDDPPGLAVYVRHDAMGDACRALVSEQLAFDITPAFQLRRWAAGGNGWLRLDVIVPGERVPILVHTGVRLPEHPDQEAELLALHLSGKLCAYESLIEKVAGDLAAIRAAHGATRLGSGRKLEDVRFHPPWMPARLVVGMDEAAFAEVEAGTYHAWDDANAALGLEDIHLLGSIRFLVLSFTPRFHPCRLVDLYRDLDLPGITYLGSDLMIGDSPNIYPRSTPGGITYLFYEGWGDCPAGCIDREYRYAVPEPGGAFAVLGPYDPASEVIPPPWWSEAQQNLDLFRSAGCPWEASAPQNR